MYDYGTMQKTLRSLNEHSRTLAGMPCPNANCFGTLRHHDGELACTGDVH